MQLNFAVNIFLEVIHQDLSTAKASLHMDEHIDSISPSTLITYELIAKVANLCNIVLLQTFSASAVNTN